MNTYIVHFTASITVDAKTMESARESASKILSGREAVNLTLGHISHMSGAEKKEETKKP